MSADIHLGFEVGTGEPVAIPAGHMAVTGQTQQAGKTTALEALISRSGCRAIAFVTKRGEASFADGRRIQPYFRDRVDWQFVESILESVMQQKMRFERAWIVRASKGAKTLSAVQFNVRKLMDESRGLSADVYMLLDQYLSLVVPLLKQLPAATSIELCPGLNVMDLSGYPMQVQGLVIRSTLEWVYEHERDVVTVIPEAWEFIPESRGSPVKLAAEALVRKGAALRNFAWIDSQDMAGVAKVLLRAASVWLIGVQREHNEVARALKHIPAGIKKPKPEDVSSLKLGQFWACWHGRTVKAYVQPAWMGDQQAREIAKRDAVPAGFARAPVRPTAPPVPRKPESDAENGEECSMDSDLKRLLEQQARATQVLLERFAANGAAAPTPAEPAAAVVAGDEEQLYQRFKARLLADAQRDPGLLQVLVKRPEISVKVERHTLELDGSTPRGRIARLVAAGFYDQGATNSATRSELKRTGSDVNNANIGRVLDELVSQGFLTREGSDYKRVPSAKVTVKE